MGISEIQTFGWEAWQMQFWVFFEGRKVLKESGVRISYSSALTHRKRGLDFAVGGLFALSIDSVRGWLRRCLGPFGTS